MGQLEKYGLYVLCLVIFLILGVTIWGGGDLQQPPRRGNAPAASSELNANPRTAHAGAPSGPLGNTVSPVGERTPPPVASLDSLLERVPPPSTKPPVKVDKEKVDPKTVEPKAIDPGAAAKPPTGSPKPAAETVRPVHKVAAGDTFDSIAREKLGSASLRTEIARLNPKVEPSRMKPGVELQLPTATELAALRKGKDDVKVADASSAKKPSVGDGTYTIEKGDTFASIARKKLGSAKRVNELLDANPNVDPLRLREGTTIRLPKN